MVFAHQVPHKGADDGWIIAQLVSHVKRMGADKTGAILKGDQEPAISSLINRVREACPNIVEERSKLHDSASNGVVERAIQQVEKLLRVHLLSLENKLCGKIPVDHPVVSWLIQHVSDLINKFLVGHDGRTAYERLRGKPYRGEIVEFGSKVLCKPPDKLRGGSMRSRWDLAVWVGKAYAACTAGGAHAGRNFNAGFEICKSW